MAADIAFIISFMLFGGSAVLLRHDEPEMATPPAPPPVARPAAPPRSKVTVRLSRPAYRLRLARL